MDALLDEVFDPEGPCSSTHAVVVVHRGRLVAERYAGALEHFNREPEPIGADTPLLSWSMAKSMVQAVTYQLIEAGHLELHAPAPVPSWSDPGDPRGAITLADLLAMRDGLDFAEDYVDDRSSDVIEMLFGSGKADVAHYAESRPLKHAPGSHYSYSSGTTNIVSAICARVLGPGDPYRAHLDQHLFGPLHMTSARTGFDDAGTFIGSSFVHATARDYAKFGLCYLRGGQFNGTQVVPPAAVEAARTPLSTDPDGPLYSSHWWMPGDEHGTFSCNGYQGQVISVSPALDLIVVRLGQTPIERAEHLVDWRERVIAAFAEHAGTPEA